MANAKLEVAALPAGGGRWTEFPLELPLQVRYALAAAIVLIAYGLLSVLRVPAATHGFLTFYPAAGLATIVLGAGPGLFAIACCLALAVTSTCPLMTGGVLNADNLVALATYSVSCSVLCAGAALQHRARARPVDTEEPLCGLLASSHVGVVLTNELGVVVESNQAYRTILGYGAGELRSLDSNHLAAADTGTIRVTDAAVWEATGSRGQAVNTEYRRKDGSSVAVRVSSARYLARHGRRLRWTMVEDRTTENQAHQNSVRHLREFKVVAENRLVGIVLVKSRRIAWANEAFATMFGYTPTEIIGQTTRVLHATQAEADGFRERMRPAMEAGGVFRSLVRQVRKDGTVGWYVMSCATLSDSTDEQIGTFVDVTERKHLEAMARDAAARERRQLGADLHDGLGQELTAISLLVGVLRTVEGDAAREKVLHKIEAIARHSVTTCRDVARGLSPVSDAEDGLVTALADMVARAALNSGADVRFEPISSVNVSYAPDVVDQLFRIAQESVNNAVKHAAAQSVIVRLTQDQDAVQLDVCDDGAANGSLTTSTPGMGLKIMRDRASRIGARLTIGAGAGGRGTVVSCRYERDHIDGLALMAADMAGTGLRPLGNVAI